MFSADLTIFAAVVGAVIGSVIGVVAWATSWSLIKFLLGGTSGAIIATVLAFGVSLYVRRFLGPAEIYIGMLIMAIIGLISGAIIGIRKNWPWEELGT
jgi:FtsH-binding integral membrane protein